MDFKRNEIVQIWNVECQDERNKAIKFEVFSF